MTGRFTAAVAAACTIAVAATTGAALAGNGNGTPNNGNGNGGQPAAAQPAQPAQTPPGQAKQEAPAPAATPPGQAKQESPAATAPTAAPAATPPGQAKKESATPTQAATPAQAKHATAQPATPAAIRSSRSGAVKKVSASTAPGVKPGSTTKHWTHCTTGSGATCSNGTPTSPPDASKRYGNGTTAAQIAVSRGAPDGTVLTGPGNSQPHKVTVCGKPSNRSGGVDVHAVKSYDTSACAPAPRAADQSASVSACDTTTTSVVGVLHVNGQGRGVHVMTNTHSAHFTSKHPDDLPLTVQTTTAGACSSGASTPSAPSTASTAATSAATAVAAPAATPSIATALTGATTPVGAAPAAVIAAGPGATGAGISPAGAAPSAGGVLGAEVTLHHPTAAHGVLGAVHTTRPAGSSLPFTGLSLDMFCLVAAGLLGMGLLLRRTTRTDRR